ncbi:MAG TPA: DUF1579 family protein [Chloroflexota bacterium]|nr:DUF1579 family protein [Chloroflexota bacterium]
MFEMPRPTREHARLAALAGTWVGEERLLPSGFDPVGGMAVGRFTARMALDGFYLIADYEQARNGTPNFRGHGVYGWDPRGRCYTMHWFDSIGIEHDAPGLGTWEADTLTLVHETRHTGSSRYVYTVGDGVYSPRLEHAPDRQAWTTVLEGTYRRIGDPPGSA